MKIAGIIAEYNPFHNGHRYHIEETRRVTGCDYVVICMSGSFTQRGEIACMSKFKRAEAALRCGADAVFELPALFAVRTADTFARGGVHILSSVGCDLLSFGCESADMALIRSLAELRENEPEILQTSIREKLGGGLSHARARGEAIAEYIGVDPGLFASPNLILAAEYLNAVSLLRSGMDCTAIPRIGDYHSGTLSGQYASAAAIRSDIRSPKVTGYVPECTAEMLTSLDETHPLDDVLLYRLRGMSARELAELPDVAEGLENRVAECALTASSRDELIAMIKCKRYTYARISRLCAHALLGINKTAVQNHYLPEYARLIGMRRDAGELLHELKKRSSLPILTKASELIPYETFDIERRATDLFALTHSDPSLRKAGCDLTAKFLSV